MSIRTAPPFRADHVGSFLRPAYLLEARDQFFNQKSISAAQLDTPWLARLWHLHRERVGALLEPGAIPFWFAIPTVPRSVPRVGL